MGNEQLQEVGTIVQIIYLLDGTLRYLHSRQVFFEDMSSEYICGRVVGEQQT